MTYMAWERSSRCACSTAWYSPESTLNTLQNCITNGIHCVEREHHMLPLALPLTTSGNRRRRDTERDRRARIADTDCGAAGRLRESTALIHSAAAGRSAAPHRSAADALIFVKTTKILAVNTRQRVPESKCSFLRTGSYARVTPN
ncbi:jg11727 [Pararge aegeria aegeria]|uniref:Jg11727 protein n=1 Tax=Pararge aegeria aegeria TaxID=348720 RepID=A0A8S4S318_9NEOP|nr:jg11727 [Pararge aegeria aegeria]